MTFLLDRKKGTEAFDRQFQYWFPVSGIPALSLAYGSIYKAMILSMNSRLVRSERHTSLSQQRSSPKEHPW
jgi:hypothetical protein